MFIPFFVRSASVSTEEVLQLEDRRTSAPVPDRSAPMTKVLWSSFSFPFYAIIPGNDCTHKISVFLFPVIYTRLKSLSCTLWPASSKKLPEDLIQVFCAKLYVTCRHRSGSSLESGAFYMIEWFMGGLTNKYFSENGHIQGLDWKRLKKQTMSKEKLWKTIKKKNKNPRNRSPWNIFTQHCDNDWHILYVS